MASTPSTANSDSSLRFPCLLSLETTAWWAGTCSHDSTSRSAIGSRIGAADFEIRGIVTSEPDRIRTGSDHGPRVFVSGQGLVLAGLEQFGSRINYRTLIQLEGEPSREELTALAEEIRGWPDFESRYRVETYATCNRRCAEH